MGGGHHLLPPDPEKKKKKKTLLRLAPLWGVRLGGEGGLTGATQRRGRD